MSNISEFTLSKKEYTKIKALIVINHKKELKGCLSRPQDLAEIEILIPNKYLKNNYDLTTYIEEKTGHFVLRIEDPTNIHTANKTLTDQENIYADHSACLIILADSIESAKQIARNENRMGSSNQIKTDPFEIPLTPGPIGFKGGTIIAYANGDC